MAEQDTARVARNAAVHSLVSNGVYLLLVGAVMVAMTRRDWLTRQALRLQALACPGCARKNEEVRAMRQVQREISLMEHGQGD